MANQIVDPLCRVPLPCLGIKFAGKAVDHMKKIKSLLIIFLLSAAFSAGSLARAEGYYGLDKAATNAELKTDGDTSLPQLIGSIVGVALSFLGVVFLILIIYAGLLWMTARGNEAEVTKAKDIIIAAIIGLIIVLAAYIIVNYIGGVFGQSSTQ